MLRYRRPSFVSLYSLFGVSLVVLVVFSFIFFSRHKSQLEYSREADRSHDIIYQLQKLQGSLKDFESSGRGFMLTLDSSYIANREEYIKDGNDAMDSLMRLFENDEMTMNQLRLLKNTVTNRINTQNSNIQRVVTGDTSGLTDALNRGDKLMTAFRSDALRIEKEALRDSAVAKTRKNLFESILPNSFSIIMIFSGVITLLSFFLIIREMRIRQKYQEELERRLNELNRSYAELEQFTFVASHDLQEPLRKIRTFSDRLLSWYKTSFDARGVMILERLDLAAQRLQELIQDVTNFATLINKEENIGKVDLNKVLEKVEAEFAPIIRQRNVEIRTDKLPTIKGYPEQIFLLFKAIIDNSIKFSSLTEQPVIRLFYTEVNGEEVKLGRKERQQYHKVIIEDNGIGFDNEFAEKIFMIFQRLHTQQSDYHGKGIGLAIAQRVMVNHDGFITAKGDPGKGAVFTLFFPVTD